MMWNVPEINREYSTKKDNGSLEISGTSGIGSSNGWIAEKSGNSYDADTNIVFNLPYQAKVKGIAI